MLSILAMHDLASWPCVFNASTIQFSLPVSENLIDSVWAKYLSLVKLAGQRATGSLRRLRQGEDDWHFSQSEISTFLNSDRWCVITYLCFLFVILHSVLRVLLTINKLLMILPSPSGVRWSSLVKSHYLGFPSCINTKYIKGNSSLQCLPVISQDPITGLSL